MAITPDSRSTFLLGLGIGPLLEGFPDLIASLMAITVDFVATAQLKLFAIRFLPRLTVTSPTHSLAAARFLRFATIP